MKSGILNTLKHFKGYLNLISLFFSKKLGSKSEYLEVFEIAKSQTYPEIDKYLLKFNFLINKNWLDNLALHTQVTIKKSKINYQHGRIIYSLLCSYINNNLNKNIVIFESGTAKGFSAICMSKALNDLKRKGVIYTTDIVPHNVKMYWNTIDDHVQGKITREKLLENWKHELKNIEFYNMKSVEFFKKKKINRIHFAFLDAVHDGDNIMTEFEYVKKLQLKGDIIIFDDFDDQYNSLKNYISRVVPDFYNYKVLESDINRHYFIAIKK